MLIQFKDQTEPTNYVNECLKTSPRTPDFEKSKIESVEVTTDHNFDVDREYRRIMSKYFEICDFSKLAHGGRIEKMKGGMGPLR